jgi:transcription initiation factor TFIIIB Brf1 subunit/transcription initiation factor TFIIB
VTDHAAAELYRQALAEHAKTSGSPKPVAAADIEAVVRRLPGNPLNSEAAMAEVEKHLAANLHPRAANMLRQLKASAPEAPKKTLGLWAKKSVVRESVDLKAQHALQVAALESAVDHLSRGKVPPMFAHLMPRVAPVIHNGPDVFIVEE